jgi:hypothetical protein
VPATIDDTGTGASAAATSHAVSVGAGTADKLIAIGFLADPGTVTPPTGWTLRASNNQGSGGTAQFLRVFTRAATSDTSVAVDTANSVASAHIWRVYGSSDIAGATFPTPSIGTSTAPDPPATGTITSGDYLVDTGTIWGRGRNFDAYPTGYDEDQLNNLTQSSPRVAMAADTLTGITSTDPGAYDLAGSSEWVAFTVAIPEGGGGGGTEYSDTPVFTAAAVLSVASSLAHTEALELAAVGVLSVVDVLSGGGTEYSDTPNIFAAATVDVATTLEGHEAPDVAAGGLLTIIDVWSGDANLTPVVWRLELALGVEGGVGGLWDTGQWDTTGVWAGDEPTWVRYDTDLLSANPTMGRDKFEDRMRTATMAVELANDDGKYNPDYGATAPGDLALRPGRLIRLSGNVGLGYVAVFRGVIDDIVEVYGPGGGDINTRMQCVGYAADMALDNPPALGSAVGAGERTDERVARVLDAIDWPDATRNLQTGVHTMQATTLARSRLEEIQRAADAEGGAFFFDAEGVATFKAQGWLENDARSTTPQIYPGRGSAGDPSVIGVSTEWTRRTIINDAQYTRVGGTMQRDFDLTSVALYGGFRTARRTDLEVETDAQALTLAEQLVTARAYDRLRVTGLSLSALDLASGRALLELQLGDLVEATVTTLHGWGYTIQAHVMRITHVVVADDWVVELRVDDAVTYSPT